MSLLVSLLISMLVDQAADSDLQVVELFRAETAEELRSALADGYPMPWLAEILADTTIPEEDRYWLDCRMRAVIAQDLHMFFDGDGKAVFVQADWIAPGEDYWRECFLANPQGTWPRGEVNQRTGLWGKTGLVLSRYGERIGSLALCEQWMSLSRDGAVGALMQRGSEHVSEMGPAFFFLVYSDGSYFMLDKELWLYDFMLSQSGAYAVLVYRETDGSNQILMMNGSGEVLWQREAAARVVVNAPPSISGSDRLCVIQSVQDRTLHSIIQVFDVATGEELQRLDGPGPRASFSENGRYLCLAGNIGGCYSITSWDEAEIASELQPSMRELLGLCCSNTHCSLLVSSESSISLISLDSSSNAINQLTALDTSGAEMDVVGAISPEGSYGFPTRPAR